jgi:4-diphosphocytidyl-2-C-methyl-D-erythritol kinase
MTTNSLTLSAFAKINLHLNVGPRRNDGYHSLETLFQEISLHDTLTFAKQKSKIQLTVTPPTLPTGPDNLVVKALLLLRARLGVQDGMKVKLVKRIPMGAGLGGGSSDAAAALWAGWRLWTGGRGEGERGREVPPILYECAKKLGADVSFFLKGGTAWATGIGEKLKSVRSPKKRWLILIYPNVHVSTKEAYTLLDKLRIADFRLRKNPKSEIRNPKLKFNSFEPVILTKFPEIARAKSALILAGCSEVMMSGSGSTVFGFVKSEKEGKSLMRKLRFNTWDLFLAHT